MMAKLHIENYRLFNKLEIDGLKQINLITGKNNTGKSALLEAIRLKKTNREDVSNALNTFIRERNKFSKNDREGFLSLVNRNTISSGEYFNIDENTFQIEDRQFIMHTSFEEQPYNIGIDVHRKTNKVRGEYIFIPAEIKFDNSELWDKVDLTHKEDEVVNAMKLIIPETERIGVSPSNKSVRLRVKDVETPIELDEYGAGAKRIFTIALALVNAENSTLLIDEVDIGLHHSIQLKLWNFIFQLAKELNVQVFATTHSYDAVDAFTQVSSKEEYADMGNYFRLQHRRDGQGIEAVNYTQKELEIATLGQIETR